MKNIVVGLGEALWDVLPDGRKNLGGAPANFAYHAGQFGIDTIAVSALGTDALGDETCAALDEKNLRYSMQRVPYPTGTVQVTLDAAGVPSYDIKEGVAWDNIRFTPELEEIAANCRAVCFGSLAQRNAVSRATIRRFVESTPKDCVRIFDINLRQSYYSKEVIEDSLKLCNVLKINDEELVIVAGMLGCGHVGVKDGRISLTEAEPVCRTLITQYGLDTVILTCGVNGSCIFASDGTGSFLDTPKVDAIDTVGAGDSFTGSFCAAVLRGLPVTRAHRLAVEVSAFVCTRHGAMPALPSSLTEI